MLSTTIGSIQGADADGFDGLCRQKASSGETSSREIVLAHLEVAERQNRVLNAWLTIDRERAAACENREHASDEREREIREHEQKTAPAAEHDPEHDYDHDDGDEKMHELSAIGQSSRLGRSIEKSYNEAERQ